MFNHLKSIKRKNKLLCLCPSQNFFHFAFKFISWCDIFHFLNFRVRSKFKRLLLALSPQVFFDYSIYFFLLQFLFILSINSPFLLFFFRQAFIILIPSFIQEIFTGILFNFNSYKFLKIFWTNPSIRITLYFVTIWNWVL